jgi:hypothetical protein
MRKALSLVKVHVVLPVLRRSTPHSADFCLGYWAGSSTPAKFGTAWRNTP